MQDDSPVAGGPVGRREGKWVSVQGSPDPLWGLLLLSKPFSGPSFSAHPDWASRAAPHPQGAWGH